MGRATLKVCRTAFVALFVLAVWQLALDLTYFGRDARLGFFTVEGVQRVSGLTFRVVGFGFSIETVFGGM